LTEPPRPRRTDRISLEVAIQVSGVDGVGHDFVEDSHAVLITRHGAKILLSRTMAPYQEVIVRCIGTSREADARIVGRIGESSEGFFYGIEFLNPEVNLWNIEFPALSEAEKAVARVLLECARCHTRELTYLNEFEAEVFEANQSISRQCKRCSDTSVWRLSSPPPSSEQIPLPVPAPATDPDPVAPARTQNERGQFRVGMKMTACIRDRLLGEEEVVTENVSRGGLAFKSPRRYDKDSMLEVSVPFTPGVGNIFSPARIEHMERLPAEGVTRYGVAYIRAQKTASKADPS
jgi:hypothetical protein